MTGDALQREVLRQQMLLRAIVNRGSGQALRGWVREAGARAQRGLQAYQANLGAAAERALAGAFPTVQQLVGEESFAALSRDFVRHHPPAHADLARLGESLPSFIAASASLRDEPYLADVARLEWAVHRAECAADHDVPPQGLERLTDTDAPRLRMRFTPGFALVESPHPIVSIWQAHRSDADDRFAPVREAFAARRGECAVVWREGWRARVATVPVPDLRFMQAASRGDDLARALATAGPGFDFEPWLLHALRERWLADIHLVET